MKKLLFLLTLAFATSGALAAIPTTATVPVSANKDTGVIAGPVSAATFRSANGIPAASGGTLTDVTITGNTTLSSDISFASGRTGSFLAGSTLSIAGTLSGTPTGGTLSLANLTLTLPATVTGGGSSFYRIGGTDVTIADGGTGASTAAEGLYNLGARAPAYPLRHTFKKLDQIAAGTTAQLRILVWGDSVAWGVPQFFVPRLQQIGVSGLKSPAVYSASTSGDVEAANGSSLAYDFTISPTGEYWRIGASGELAWLEGSNSVRADTIKIFYITESGAGSFKVQTSEDGAAYADEVGYTNVSASGATGLGVITLSKTVNYWRVKVVGLSGNVKFLKPIYRNSSESGVEIFRLDRGGIPLDSMMSCNASILASLITEIAPDLVWFEMKETAAIMAAQLPGWQTAFITNAPNADRVLVGSTPLASGDADQVAQNTILRQSAATNGNYYFDRYSPLGGYAGMLETGEEGDGVHPPSTLSQHHADLFWQEAGFGENTHGIGYGKARWAMGSFLARIWGEVFSSADPGLLFFRSDGGAKYYPGRLKFGVPSSTGFTLSMGSAGPVSADPTVTDYLSLTQAGLSITGNITASSRLTGATATISGAASIGSITGITSIAGATSSSITITADTGASITLGNSTTGNLTLTAPSSGIVRTGNNDFSAGVGATNNGFEFKRNGTSTHGSAGSGYVRLIGQSFNEATAGAAYIGWDGVTGATFISNTRDGTVGTIDFYTTASGTNARRMRITNAGNLEVSGKISPSGSTPTWTAGSGAPSASEPNGSIYSRTDGTGPNFYVRENGAWVAK